MALHYVPLMNVVDQRMVGVVSEVLRLPFEVMVIDPVTV